MTAVAYYRRAIWLPILLPILALPQYLAIYSNDLTAGLLLFDSKSPPLTISLFLIWSLLWGGVPYLILIAFSWENLRPAKAKEWKSFLATAPLKVLLPLIPNIFCIFYVARYLFYMNGLERFDSVWAYLCPIEATIIVGYLYVLLIHLLRKFLQQFGWVEA